MYVVFVLHMCIPCLYYIQVDMCTYIYIYYVAMVTAGLYIAYTPHQYST